MTLELTNTERDDIKEALHHRVEELLPQIAAFKSCIKSKLPAPKDNPDYYHHKLSILQDELERINNLLQGKFLAI